MRAAVVFFAVIILAGAWAVGSEIERRGRTETVDGVRPAGPLHLVDDVIVLAERGTGGGVSDGLIVSYDVGSHGRATLLDDLSEPVAADIAPDGTVCAVGTPVQPHEPAWLTCTSGLRVDIGSLDVPLLDGRVDRDGARPTDIVSDGRSGWIIADGGRYAVLHADADGSLAVMARVRGYPGLSQVPLGLARTVDGVAVALAAGGINQQLALADRDRVIERGSYVAGDDSVAIVQSGSVPLVLVRSPDRTGGFVTYPVGVDAEHPRIVDGLHGASGLVLLPDGRLGIAADGRLLLVRPTRLPR